MNYRHAFHAGNFADLVKHAVLTALLAELTRAAGPLTVVDTHAGAGLYRLDGAEALASGEAEAGIARLMADAAAPAVFGALKAAVRKLNPKGGIALYPGSPLLAAGALRRGDKLVAGEMRPEEAARLRKALADRPAEVVTGDGFGLAARRAKPGQRLLALIDPPFERPDDYARSAEAVAAVLARDRAASLLVWLPLKDLETFDGFLREAEEAGAGPLVVVEARMRPLADPMKMNGCALVMARSDPGIEPALRAICDWTVQSLGDRGQARVWAAG